MPKYLLSILCLICHEISNGQPKEPLTINISLRASQNDSFSDFDVAINNNSDSIVCVLRSWSLPLGVGLEPQLLAPTDTTHNRENYNLEYDAQDTSIIWEGPHYRGTAILPYHGLYFKLRIPAAKKDQFLTVEYVNVYDLCYREFMAGMIDAAWFIKYHLNRKEAPFPKKR